MKLVRNVKNNKRGFFRYSSQKRKAEEIVPPLINKKGIQARKDIEKAEEFSKFFASAFIGSQTFCISHIPEPLGNDQESKISLLCKRSSPRLS